MCDLNIVSNIIAKQQSTFLTGEGRPITIYEPNVATLADGNVVPSSVTLVTTSSGLFSFTQAAQNRVMALGYMNVRSAMCQMPASMVGKVFNRYCIKDDAGRGWVVLGDPITPETNSILLVVALVMEIQVNNLPQGMS